MRGAVWVRLAEGHTGDLLARGEGPGLSPELPDRELGPCERLQRGLGGSLYASRTGVCISIALYLPHLYCVPWLYVLPF